jgi:hypothetical protein
LSGVFGFTGEFTGGELRPAGAVAVVNDGSRGEGEGWAGSALGLGCKLGRLRLAKREVGERRG